MDVMNKVITVSREFGSGGRELGVKLADALGIPFYDKELISMAADDMTSILWWKIPWIGIFIMHFLTFTRFPCRIRFSWRSRM